jgi:uncharacterized Zn-binding protein involved in type VI secretion
LPGEKPAARVGDPIAHSSSLFGALAGLVAGALIGVAIVATGGLGAVAIGAAIAVTGGAGLAGEYVGESIPGSPCGAIATGSMNVFINDRPASCVVIGTAPCADEGGAPEPEATGAATVLINGMPAGRVGETMQCSAKIIEGSKNVAIGGPSVQVLELEPETPAWLNTTMSVMAWGGAFVATGGVWAACGAGAAIGGLGGSMAFGWLGGEAGGAIARAAGLGETGQRIAKVVGNVLGSFGGGYGGAKLLGRTGYPGPTPESDAAFARIAKAMDEAGVGGNKGRTIGALSHKDGTVTAQFSGNKAQVEAIQGRIADKLPPNYKFAPSEVDTSHLEPAVGEDGQPYPGGSKCAEPKLFKGAEENPSPVDGMTTGWRGNKPNPHPSARGGNDMQPCPSCAHNEDAITKQANSPPPGASSSGLGPSLARESDSEDGD